MTLQNLIKRLEQIVDFDKLNYSEKEELRKHLKEQIFHPESSDTTKEFNLYTRDDSLILKIEYELSIDKKEGTSKINDIIKYINSNQLPKKTFYNYKVSWTPENFLEENNIIDISEGKIELDTNVKTFSGNSNRLEPTNIQTNVIIKDIHNYIHTKVKNNNLQFYSEGAFSKHEINLADAIECTHANIQLTENDRKIILDHMRKQKFGVLKEFYWDLRIKYDFWNSMFRDSANFIDPNKTYEELNTESKAKPSPKIYKLNALRNEIYRIERILEKSLSNKKIGDSHISTVGKNYHNKNTRNNSLNDLKSILRKTNFLNLDILYNSPVISLDKAVELSHDELELLSEYYTHDELRFRFMNSSGIRANGYRTTFLNKISNENLGEEFTKKYFSETTDKAFQMLHELGYNVSENLKNSTVKKKHAATDSEINISTKNKNNMENIINKERHLLEFIKQLFNKNPEKYARNVMNDYVNTELPQTTITAEYATGAFYPKISNIFIPSAAVPESLELRNYRNRVYKKYRTKDNSILISYNDTDSSLRLTIEYKIGSENPLKNIQEYAFDKCGLVFANQSIQ